MEVINIQDDPSQDNMLNRNLDEAKEAPPALAPCFPDIKIENIDIEEHHFQDNVLELDEDNKDLLFINLPPLPPCDLIVPELVNPKDPLKGIVHDTEIEQIKSDEQSIPDINIGKKLSINKCHYLNCDQKRSMGVKFYRFPNKNPKRLKQWILHSGNHALFEQEEKHFKRFALCERHFEEDSFVNDSHHRLNFLAIPKHFSECVPVSSASKPHIKLSLVPFKLQNASSSQSFHLPSSSSAPPENVSIISDSDSSLSGSVLRDTDKQPAEENHSERVSICERHFEENSFVNNRLNLFAIPRQYVPVSSASKPPIKLSSSPSKLENSSSSQPLPSSSSALPENSDSSLSGNVLRDTGKQLRQYRAKRKIDLAIHLNNLESSESESSLVPLKPTALVDTPIKRRPSTRLKPPIKKKGHDKKRCISDIKRKNNIIRKLRKQIALLKDEIRRYKTKNKPMVD